jgi:hypothetical protein
MKRQLVIAVLALIGVTGAAFADTPYTGGKADEMAPAGVSGQERTVNQPETGPDGLPPSPYGFTNQPSGIYNWNP